MFNHDEIFNKPIREFLCLNNSEDSYNYLLDLRCKEIKRDESNEKSNENIFQKENVGEITIDLFIKSYYPFIEGIILNDSYNYKI